MIQSRQIEAFNAVMQSGGMTAAAELIHVTQPAISRLIRDLEHEVGFPLFIRRGNLVSPTAEAHALMAEVGRVFSGLAQLGHFADNLRSGFGGTLRIAALPAMSMGFLPRFLAGFCRDRPQVNVMLDGLDSPTIRDRVGSGQFDIGFTAYPFRRDTLQVTPLNDLAVVLMPDGHRLAEKTTITAADLHDEPVVLLSKFRLSLHPITVEMQSSSRPSRIDTPIGQIACVLAQEGMGLAIVDPFTAHEFVGRGMVMRLFAPGLVVGTAIIYARDRPLSLLARQFHDAFLEHTTRFLQDLGCIAPSRARSTNSVKAARHQEPESGGV